MNNPRTYWDTFTTSYQMGAQKHRVYLLDLLQQKEVKSILDDGCGTGPIYELIKNTAQEGTVAKRWRFEYKGTDYSPAMIEVCKQSFPEGNFEVEDARHLTEADNSWDCVLLMHSLDHLDDYKAAIKEAARVARKYVCIVLWRPLMDTESNNLNDRNMYGKEAGDEPWQDTHLQDYSRKLLEKEFANNNLTIEKTAEGDEINSDASHYNFLYLLKK